MLYRMANESAPHMINSSIFIFQNLQVDMQLVCFAVNYVGSAMAKTRLKTSSASEIGVTGADAAAVTIFGEIVNNAPLASNESKIANMIFDNRIFASVRNLTLKSLPRHSNSRGHLGRPTGTAVRRRADNLGQWGDADVDQGELAVDPPPRGYGQRGRLLRPLQTGMYTSMIQGAPSGRIVGLCLL